MAFSLDDKHIVIHYHYIEDPNSENKGMNSCPVFEFEKHIHFLSKHYAPATLQEIFEAAKHNSPKRYYSITFDDGLKDQYENAVPILKRYDGKATFFIITQTLEGVLPSAHKLHVILSRFSVFEIIDMWNTFLKRRHPEYAARFFIPKDRRMVKDRRLYADIPTANIKETFTAVPPAVRDEFLNFIFDTHHFDEAESARNIFLNEDEIQDLEEKGFEIGVHTHVHEPIGALGAGGLHNDFKKSKKWFKKITGKEPKIFSYPYGIIPPWGSSAVAKEGITHAVTVEEGPIATNDRPLLIPRYDMATIRTFLT
ncbi:MAG: polysaccharide deacetylase family protein [bacterium]|nr:polysaccharide deacetylase family protein [bacterium]